VDALLDWDDLSIGDPALDFVILTWPLRLETTRGDTAFRERCALYRRAQLLDSVIDPLADYIEAPHDLDQLDEVQAAKRLEHEESLKQYRRQYR
jgi:aminoglycoside phosphotransferase (APT) family kinase protein